MAINTPDFHPGYAALILLFLAACASLFKPKKNYMPLRRNQFKEDGCCNNLGVFCLARVQYWTIRFVFYYAIPHVAIGLYLITIVLTISISTARVNRDFHYNLDIMKNHDTTLCPQLSDDLIDIADTTQAWSDQLTWFLIAYFFQKMFGATLLTNAGGGAIIVAVIFDPWLLISTFWGQNIQQRLYSVINTNEMNNCINEWDINTSSELTDSLENILFAVNDINICLWAMCTMSLSVGLVIDIFFTSIREFEYYFKPDLKPDKEIWNCFGKAADTFEDIGDAVDQAAQDLGVADKDDTPENNKDDTPENNKDETPENLIVPK